MIFFAPDSRCSIITPNTFRDSPARGEEKWCSCFLCVAHPASFCVSRPKGHRITEIYKWKRALAHTRPRIALLNHDAKFFLLWQQKLYLKGKATLGLSRGKKPGSSQFLVLHNRETRMRFLVAVPLLYFSLRFNNRPFGKLR